MKAFKLLRDVMKEVKAVDKEICELKKLVGLIKASVDRLPTRNPSEGLLANIHKTITEITDFISSYKEQGLFDKSFFARKKNKSKAKGLEKELLLLYNVLQTDTYATILQVQKTQGEIQKTHGEILKSISLKLSMNDKQGQQEMERLKREATEMSSPRSALSPDPTPEQLLTPEQMYEKGNEYYEGLNGVVKNRKLAVDWYRKSADQGNALAQTNLGFCYENGEGVAKDIKQAAFWYRQSAEQGNAMGQNSLGTCYYNGEGVAKDHKQAVFWYRKSAEQGNALGQYNLGDCYYNGQGVDQDYKEAVVWYSASAEHGDAGAKKKLDESWAQPYLNQPGAIRQLLGGVVGVLASPTSNPADMYKKGNDYYEGNGVAKDYKQAVFWYRKSADRGNASGQAKLGLCYRDGQGVDQDFEEAVAWFRKSAEQGDAWGQYLLGTCYDNGDGVAKDLKQAVFWYRKSKDQGNEKAQMMLS